MPQCFICDSTETALNKWGREYWAHNYDDRGKILHYICQNCHNWLKYFIKHPIQRHRKYLNHFCYSCGAQKSRKNIAGCYKWFLNNDEEDNVLCDTCADRYCYADSNRKHMKRISSRMINFLGKKILLLFELKKGRCLRCYRTVKSGIIKTTLLHHYFYIPCIPWACTEEFCRRCHINEHRTNWKDKNLCNATT